MTEHTELPLDPDAPTTAAEEAEAATLMRSLADDAPHETADFARALKAAHSPAALPEDLHRALIAKHVHAPPARGQLVRITFAASFAVWAAAAAWVFYARFQSARFDEEEASAMRRSRTTAALFSEPFRTGERSARIDRIAMARAEDYRRNRYGAWGIR